MIFSEEHSTLKDNMRLENTLELTGFKKITYEGEPGAVRVPSYGYF
jgi:hypothetical protein